MGVFKYPSLCPQGRLGGDINELLLNAWPMIVSTRKGNMMARRNTCKCPREMWGRIRRKSPIPQVL